MEYISLTSAGLSTWPSLTEWLTQQIRRLDLADTFTIGLFDHAREGDHGPCAQVTALERRMRLFRLSTTRMSVPLLRSYSPSFAPFHEWQQGVFDDSSEGWLISDDFGGLAHLTTKWLRDDNGLRFDELTYNVRNAGNLAEGTSRGRGVDVDGESYGPEVHLPLTLIELLSLSRLHPMEHLKSIAIDLSEYSATSLDWLRHIAAGMRAAEREFEAGGFDAGESLHRGSAETWSLVVEALDHAIDQVAEWDQIAETH